METMWDPAHDLLHDAMEMSDLVDRAFKIKMITARHRTDTKYSNPSTLSQTNTRPFPLIMKVTGNRFTKSPNGREYV